MSLQLENLFLEPTNRCNLKCAMCGFDPQYPRGDMTFEAFEDVVRQLARDGLPANRYVRLWQMGEPLVHPRIVDMVAHLSKKGFYPCLSSNGTLLSRAVSERLLDAGLKWLQVSLDKIDPGEYRHWRGNSPHERIVENLNTFLSLRDARGMDTTVVVLFIVPWTAAQRQNATAMPADEVARILRFLESRFCAPVGLEIRPLLKWPLMLRTDADTIPPPYHPRLPALCHGTAHTLTVKWNGDVMPCCMDLNGLTVIGNVRRDSIADLWNERVPRFRSAMSEGKVALASCLDCPLYFGWRVFERRAREQLAAARVPSSAELEAGITAAAEAIAEADRCLGGGVREKNRGIFARLAPDLDRMVAKVSADRAADAAAEDAAGEFVKEIAHLRNYLFQMEDLAYAFNCRVHSPARGLVMAQDCRVVGEYVADCAVDGLDAAIDGATAPGSSVFTFAGNGGWTAFVVAVPLAGLARQRHLLSVDARVGGNRVRKRVGDFLLHPDPDSDGWIAGTALRPDYVVLELPAQALLAPDPRDRISP